MKDEFKWINILKGLGIMSVVIGHACASVASSFVYSYHLALFFFVSGFLYNEEKYGLNPYLNLGNRFKSCYGKFVIYAAVIGLLNNLWGKLHIVSEASAGFSFYGFRNYLLNTMVLNNTNPLFGPAWFVLALLCCSITTGFIISFAIKVSGKKQIKWIKHLTIILLTIAFTAMGWERFKIGFYLYARLDVGLFVLPISIAGYYCRLLEKKISRFIFLPGAIATLIITIFCVYKLGWRIDLCGQHVIMYQFIILSFSGIYLMVYLSKKIVSLKLVSSILSEFGKYSFEIMCFHFLCFKFVDVILSKCIHETNIQNLAAIPYTYNLGIVYVIIGCVVPTAVCIGCRYIKNKAIARI